MAIALEDIVGMHSGAAPRGAQAPEEDPLGKFITIPSPSAPQEDPLNKFLPPTQVQGSNLQRAIVKGAEERGIDPAHALALFHQESGMNPSNPRGGLGNFIPSTASSRGLDWNKLLSDPQYNIDSSLDYLKELQDQSGGDVQKALVRYNGGGDPQYLEHVQRHLPKAKAFIQSDMQGAQASKEAETPAKQEGFLPQLMGQVGRSALGAGEAWASVLSSIPAATVGYGGMAAGIVTQPWRLFEPGFLTGLHNEAQDVIARHAYQPQTPEGQWSARVLTTPFNLGSDLLERSRQSNVALGMPEDLSYLLKDASEVAMFYFADKGFRALLPERSTMSKFVQEVKRGEPSAETAQEVVAKYQKHPAAVQRLEAEKGKAPSIEEMRAEQVPTPEMPPPETPPEGPVEIPRTAIEPPSPTGEVNTAGDVNPTVFQRAMDVLSDPNRSESDPLVQSAKRYVARAGSEEAQMGLVDEWLARPEASSPPLTEQAPPFHEDLELGPQTPSVPPPEPPLRVPRRVRVPAEPEVRFPELQGNEVQAPGGGVVDTGPSLMDLLSIPREERAADIRGVRGERPQLRSHLLETLEEGAREDAAQLATKNPLEPSRLTKRQKVRAAQEVSTPLVSPEDVSNVERGVEQGTPPEEFSLQAARNYDTAYRQYQDASNGVFQAQGKGPEALAEAQAWLAEATGRFQEAQRASKLADVYERAWQNDRAGIHTSEARGVMDILRDLKTILGVGEERGSLDPSGLSRRKRLALQRLEADAHKVGENLEDYLRQFHGLSDPNIQLTPAHLASFGAYLKQINNPPPPLGIGPKDMSLEGSEMPGTGKNPVVQQRVIHEPGKPQRTFPPTYMDEAARIIDAQEEKALPSGMFRGPAAWYNYQMENPLRWLERSGLRDIYDTYRKTNRAAGREIQAVREELQRLTKPLDYQSMQKIYTSALDWGQTGKQTLEALGLKPERLTPQELAAKSHLEGRLLDQWTDINVMRKAIGQEELPPPENVFVTMRAMNVMHDYGQSLNLLKDDVGMIGDRLRYYENGLFPKTLTQKGLSAAARRLGSTEWQNEMNLFRQYDKFMERTIRQYHLSPLTAKLHELINTDIPDVQSPSSQQSLFGAQGAQYPSWSLRDNKPNLWNKLNDWNMWLDGHSNYPTRFDPLLRKLGENLAWSMISGNLRSFTAQVTSLPKVWWETNLAYTMKGVGRALAEVMGLDRKGFRAERLRRSQILDVSKAMSAYGDLADSFSTESMRSIGYALREGRLRDAIGGVARGGSSPIQWADIETNKIAFDVGLEFAEARLGLKGAEAAKWADDMVIRTQHTSGVGDVAPAQRSQIGRALTLFQTYTIREWNWLLHDVFGVKSDVTPWGSPQTLKQVAVNTARLIGIYTAWNMLMDHLHIHGHTPSPLHDAMRTKEHGGNALNVAAAFVLGTMRNVPVLGGSRLHQGLLGPVLTTVTQQLPNAMLGERMAQGAGETAAKVVGVPFTGAAMNVARSMKRAERLGVEFNPWDHLLGWEGPPKEGGRGEGLGSGSSSSLGSGRGSLAR